MARNSFYFSLLGLIVLTSCTTGTTLRSARTLTKGTIELSGGLVTTNGGGAAPVVIAAYGVTDSFEIEGRWEDGYIAVTPRLQLLTSEQIGLNCLTFFEVGYNDRMGLQWGPGLMMGRKWDYIEPYLSYRYRHFNHLGSHHKHENKHHREKMWLDIDESYCQYVKLGTRFYFSPPAPTNAPKHSKRWFLGIEAGPTWLQSAYGYIEFAANVGLDY